MHRASDDQADEDDVAALVRDDEATTRDMAQAIHTAFEDDDATQRHRGNRLLSMFDRVHAARDRQRAAAFRARRRHGKGG